MEIGIDIVDIERFKAAVEKNKKFKARIFSEKEIKYCRSKKNGIENMAGRFAAKEAVYKAVNKVVGAIALKDIEILSGSGAPVLSPVCLLGQKLGKKGLECRLSISHNRSHAVASALLYMEGR
ncbi:MAG: holo-ACP synthase [Elusimicrobiota bacterium]|nr:holo-ACP synthase [Elusimicrobiota bacterium]